MRSCLQAPAPAALDAAVAGWAVGRLTAQRALAAGATVDLVPAAPGRRVIALDGKALWGSAPRATPEPAAAAAQGGGDTHLVAALDQASGAPSGRSPVPSPAGVPETGSTPKPPHLSQSASQRSNDPCDERACHRPSEASRCRTSLGGQNWSIKSISVSAAWRGAVSR